MSTGSATIGLWNARVPGIIGALHFVYAQPLFVVPRLFFLQIAAGLSLLQLRDRLGFAQIAVAAALVSEVHGPSVTLSQRFSALHMPGKASGCARLGASSVFFKHCTFRPDFVSDFAQPQSTWIIT